MTKLPKDKVAFEHPAKGPHHCSQCEHYVRPVQLHLRKDEPADPTGSCEIVAGKIAPVDWCKKFKARRK